MALWAVEGRLDESRFDPMNRYGTMSRTPRGSRGCRSHSVFSDAMCQNKVTFKRHGPLLR